MKALLIDKLPFDHRDKKDFFIYQEGNEPNVLSGPTFLHNLEKSEMASALVVDESGKICKKDLSPLLDSIKNSLRYFQSGSFLENISPACERLAEQKIEEALERHSAIFIKGKWFGDDLGSKEEPLVHIYSKGEFFGLRLENCDQLPSFSSKSVGRLFYLKSDESIYLDVGNRLKNISSEKFEKDIQVSNPLETILIGLEDSDICDARRTLWQVCQNGDDFKRINCKISTPSENLLVIELPSGSPAGTYRILGVE